MEFVMVNMLEYKQQFLNLADTKSFFWSSDDCESNSQLPF